MPAALADIGVLRRDDPPAPVDPAQHARADALAIRLAVLVMHDLAGDPKARMHDCDVGCEKMNVHLRRPPRACPEWAVGAVQALHQVAEAVARRGPGAV